MRRTPGRNRGPDLVIDGGAQKRSAPHASADGGGRGRSPCEVAMPLEHSANVCVGTLPRPWFGLDRVPLSSMSRTRRSRRSRRPMLRVRQLAIMAPPVSALR